MVPGSKLDECWRVVRDHGWVQMRDIAGMTGYSEHRVAPLVWWLTWIGWAVHRDGRYASARTARW